MRLLAALVLTSFFAVAQQPTTARIAGDWEGTSLCTIKDSPCHDEHVVYHIKPDKADQTKYEMVANKIVNGEEEFMGTLTCVFTAANNELYCDTYGDWRFTVSGDAMKGTLTLKNGTLYRNIDVHRRQ